MVTKIMVRQNYRNDDSIVVCLELKNILNNSNRDIWYEQIDNLIPYEADGCLHLINPEYICGMSEDNIEYYSELVK